jgi:DNA helicase II / ATP-dependent DNA helicase PcrA
MICPSEKNVNFVGMTLDDLNPPQRRAATTIAGPVLILAGAGTGKTRVITARIAHLLRSGVRPEDIMAVTFTNKAATEMRERVGKLVAKEKGKLLTISTFHSLCVRILRTEIERLGYKRNFTIYTQSEQTGLMRRIIVKSAAKGEKLDAGVALGLMSRERNKGVRADANPEALINVVAREYRRQMKLLNAVDFDDLLVLAEQVLRDHPEARARWNNRFKHVMVDEFQDTNRMQLDLLHSLVGPERNLCVVGDDDQSIYGFRGAELSNILGFERHFPNPTVVTLEENYRSTNPILNVANGVIKHNRERRAKKLWSQQEGADPVRVIAMPGEVEEAEFIADEIEVVKSREQLGFEDFAILFRTNLQTRVFEETMRARKIPYRVIGTNSFFDRREVKDVLAWLSILVNPSDDINLLRVINTPPRGLGETLVENATALSVTAKVPIFTTLQASEFQSQLSKKSQAALAGFVELLRTWQEKLAGEFASMADLTNALVTSIEYLPWLKRQCKDEQEATMRESSIFDLMESMRHRVVNTETDLIDFLSTACLEEKRDSAEDDEEKKRGVSLITMHAAKGLEFPIVYLPGIEEGILPHSRSVLEGTKEEERRLLYVAITRARRRLTVSHCQTRKKYGDKVSCSPSSFLKELDKNYIQTNTWHEICRAPVSADDAKSGFAALRAMMGRPT